MLGLGVRVAMSDAGIDDDLGVSVLSGVVSKIAAVGGREDLGVGEFVNTCSRVLVQAVKMPIAANIVMGDSNACLFSTTHLRKRIDNVRPMYSDSTHTLCVESLIQTDTFPHRVRIGESGIYQM